MDVSTAQRGRPRWASAGAVPGQGPRGQGRETAASPSARLSARPMWIIYQEIHFRFLEVVLGDGCCQNCSGVFLLLEVYKQSWITIC